MTARSLSKVYQVLVKGLPLKSGNKAVTERTANDLMTYQT